MLLLFPLIIITLLSGRIMPVNPPRAEITNGSLKAGFCLPDAESGYYRGTRFDWSGVITSLEYKGHQYFGQWFDRYDPVLHDAIMGPVEEFFPLGYEDADTGGNFVKIGIGALRKPEEKGFQRFGFYQIEDPGKWIIDYKIDQVSFTHQLNHKDYGYVYTKTVRLLPGEPVMEIVHTLHNKGQKVIETDVYDHNFFVMDSTVTGPGHRVIFAFDLKAESIINKDLAEARDHTISFKRYIEKGETVLLAPVTGFGPDAKDYDFRIENHTTGAGVRITADRPLSSLVFWASLKVLSPEPYIHIKAEPGQEFSWTYRYEFYEVDD